MGCSFLHQGIFPTWGSNRGLLHCRQVLYPLSHQESPGTHKIASRSPEARREEWNRLCIKDNRRTYSVCALVLDLQPPEREIVHFFCSSYQVCSVLLQFQPTNISIQNVLHNFSVKPLLSLNHIFIFSGNWCCQFLSILKMLWLKLSFLISPVLTVFSQV